MLTSPADVWRTLDASKTFTPNIDGRIQRNVTKHLDNSKGSVTSYIVLTLDCSETLHSLQQLS
eukprot:6420027-Amphidinium_carterae.1